MKVIIIIFILVSLFSCEKALELKTSPFEPNTSAAEPDMKRWGFELTTASCGFCVYTKKISDQVEMYFYFDFEDNCYQSTGQGTSIDLGPHHTFMTDHDMDKYDSLYSLNKLEFQRDSLKVKHVLDSLQADKISNTMRLGQSSRLIFMFRPKNSSDTIDCTYNAFTNNRKELNFEIVW